jgi:hypothetical protein
MSKIFVQIASYRDPELIPTIKDCIDKAKHPENLVFAIGWQHDESENLDEFKNDNRFKIIDIPYKESKGVCWVRHQLNLLYSGEEYCMQLDSHHRFVENWDEQLIEMLKDLQKKGSKKPLITAYIPSYEPNNDPAARVHEPWMICFDRYLPEGPIFPTPSVIPNYKKLTSPIPARFFSGHFVFTLGSFVKEVVYDPNLYFHGEEINMAVRAYTHGYDLFHPHKIVAWHYYYRNGAVKQWDDDKIWNERNNSSHLRTRKLFGMDGEIKNIDFGIFDLGKVRSLEDYERFAGVRFKDRAVQQYTLDQKLAPNPIIEDSVEYEKSWIHVFKFCIDMHVDSVPENDYDAWIIAFKNADGKEIIRCDADENEVNSFKRSNPSDKWYRIWRTFYTKELPYSYVFWPHSKSKGWTERIERIIYDFKKPIPRTPDPVSLWKHINKYKKSKVKFNKNPNKRKIFVHIPAYRDPELLPTIESALTNAKHPERLVFGICHQFNEDDKFSRDIDKYRNDERFRIIDMDYTEAKGLPFARYQINTMMLDEEYILQLDSHHRFNKDWDNTLIEMHDGLKKDGVKKPLVAGYLPFYDPTDDPKSRTKEPWQSVMSCFYPHGTIFIRPAAFKNLNQITKPVPARFLSGHFCFGDNHWAKTIKHDVDIFFSGEEINLTVRSFTHGYDIYHPHKVVIWHSMTRKERDGILVWDDQNKRGENWSDSQNKARAKIRQLLQTEYNGFDLTGYDLGKERSLHDYELYSGICFKEKSVQQYTMDNDIPPNPPMSDDEWKKSLKKSFYHLVNITRDQLPANDYSAILVAFDDAGGKSVNSKYIVGKQLTDFIHNSTPIHYEEYFLTDRWPIKVVYWAVSETRGWSERIEIKL